MRKADGPADREPMRWAELAVLLLFASLVRGAMLVVMHAGLENDPDGYRSLAEGVAQTGTFGTVELTLAGLDEQVPRPTAYRPPLYPMLLAAIARGGEVSVRRVAVLHWVLGVGTVWLVYHLARRWQLGRFSLAAALLVACDPILLSQSALVMTETPATFLSVLALVCLTRTGGGTSTASAAAGGCTALAALCRPAFIIWLAAAAVWLLIAPLVSHRRRWAMVLAFAASAAMVLAPWAVRNYRRFGRPMITTTHGGYTLLLGNNQHFYQFLRRPEGRTVWDSSDMKEEWRRTIAGRPPDEPALDRLAYSQAITNIRREKGMFLWACAVRVGRLWRLVPHRLDPRESTGRRFLRYACGAWYAALFLLAAVGTISVGRQLVRPSWLWGILLCLCLTAVHTFYWTNVRMRAPLMPVVCMLAAAGLGRLRAGRSSPHLFTPTEDLCRRPDN